MQIYDTDLDAQNKLISGAGELHGDIEDDNSLVKGLLGLKSKVGDIEGGGYKLCVDLDGIKDE